MILRQWISRRILNIPHRKPVQPILVTNLFKNHGFDMNSNLITFLTKS